MLHKYTREELARIQEKSLEMALAFWGFCKEKGLCAYMCGGGCIGALRHGGFIPWDDDIDFFMPRDDYERFVRLWNSSEHADEYILSVQTEEHTDGNLFATVRDKNTTCIRPYQTDMGDIVHGVQLDVIPLDGYPKSRNDRSSQVIWALIYSLFCSGLVPEKHGRLMTVGSRVLLGIFRSKSVRYRIWSFAKKRMTKYPIAGCNGITELCSGPHYMKNYYDKVWFHTYVEVPFEGELLPIPVGAKQYLKKAFGNYMELPPEEERVAHHDCVYLDLDTPYEAYKGVYYTGR